MFEEDIEAIERRADSLIDNHTQLLRSLVRLRKRHNLTQEVVAERMGVSRPTVSGFERYDSNPTLATIRRYALAVGARIEDRVIDDCAVIHEEAIREETSCRPAVGFSYGEMIYEAWESVASHGRQYIVFQPDPAAMRWASPKWESAPRRVAISD